MYSSRCAHPLAISGGTSRRSSGARWSNSATAWGRRMFFESFRLTLRAALIAAFLCTCAARAESLDEAVKSGNRASVRTLLNQHADVNAVDSEGATPLAWAVRNDDVETARLLLTAGAKANMASRNGVTPLSLAAINRNAAMAD